MTKTKKKDSGMKSAKTKNIIFLTVTLVFGFIIGLCVDDVPFFSFDTKIDISAIIATLGLVVTIFIMPFIIDARKANLEGIKSMATLDLDTVCGYIENLIEIYKKLLSSGGKVLDESDYTVIISTFKQISSLISTLSDEFKARNMLSDFESHIKGELYQKTYEKCTENLRNGKNIDNKDIQEGIVELSNIFNEIKKYRYKLYE